MEQTTKTDGALKAKPGAPFRPWVTWVLIVAVILLAAVPLAVVKNGKWGGSDDAGSDMIMQLRPGYQPWFHSLWTPPSSEVESLLFALQAAIGAGAICYFFGLKRGAQQARRDMERERNRNGEP